MRLTTRARYALRLMLDVARNGDDGTPVSLASVSERTGISRGYLEQLALALRNNRLVRGVAGRHGGYRLSEIPSKIDGILSNRGSKGINMQKQNSSALWCEGRALRAAFGRSHSRC